MNVYLIDGTYELFRHYYALPSAKDQAGHEVAAVRGVLASVLGIIRNGATHIAVDAEHEILIFLYFESTHSLPHKVAVSERIPVRTPNRRPQQTVIVLWPI